MSLIVMIFSIVTGLIVEQAVPSSVFMGFAKPPVLALIVAYYALNHSVPMMLASALLGGILSDGIGSLPPGISPLAFAVIGAVLHHYRGTIFSGKIMTNVVFGAMIGLSMTLIVFLLLLFPGRTPFSPQFRTIFLKIAGTMIYGAVFFPVIYALLERLEMLTGAGTLHRYPNDNNSDN